MVDGEADGAIELRRMGSYDRLGVWRDRSAFGSNVSTVATLRSLAPISRWETIEKFVESLSGCEIVEEAVDDGRGG